MKVLKKINKGLILTIIVLAALLIYISGVEKQRNADKPDIRKACEDFILLTDKYVVLPEDMQKSEVSEEKVNEYVNQMKSDVEKVMISNTEAVKIQKQVIPLYVTIKRSFPPIPSKISLHSGLIQKRAVGKKA